MPRRKTTIVSSSDGRNKEGKHMLTPDSIISYRIDDSPDIHKTQAVNRICFQMNSIWDHNIPNVTLRKELIFKHIEMDAALIRSWLKGKDDNMGALIFPGSYLNVESREPKVRIERKPDLKPSTDSIQADITINKNMVPFDDKSPFVTSGMRLGTAALTTRGMKEADMVQVAEFINTVLMNHDNATTIAGVKTEINSWMKNFPLYI
jgi:hypothetical protein